MIERDYGAQVAATAGGRLRQEYRPVAALFEDHPVLPYLDGFRPRNPPRRRQNRNLDIETGELTGFETGETRIL